MRSQKSEIAGTPAGNIQAQEMKLDDPIVMDQSFSVKQECNKTTIRRGRHDKENPYFLASKKMFKDKSLSLDARGLMGYLLTLKDDWVTHPRQVASEVGVGKTKIYNLLNELIAAGYASKETSLCPKGRFTGVTYFFYEEKLDKPQEIKKQSTVSANPDTENPDPVTRTLMNKDSIDKIPNTLLKVPKGTEERVDKISPESFSSEVLETGQLMIEGMRIVKPDYSAANGKLLGMLVEIDRMIRLDKRSPEKIVEVFRWALSDSFWADKVFKPNPAKYLRDKFDQLEMKMISKPDEHKKDRKFLPSSDDNAALQKAKEMTARAL